MVAASSLLGTLVIVPILTVQLPEYRERRRVTECIGVSGCGMATVWVALKRFTMHGCPRAPGAVLERPSMSPMRTFLGKLVFFSTLMWKWVDFSTLAPLVQSTGIQ